MTTPREELKEAMRIVESAHDTQGSISGHKIERVASALELAYTTFDDQPEMDREIAERSD